MRTSKYDFKLDHRPDAVADPSKYALRFRSMHRGNNAPACAMEVSGCGGDGVQVYPDFVVAAEQLDEQ